MVDQQLKKYIQSLVKQGYDIESIKSTLIKAGHDTAKIKSICDEVFIEFNSGLVNYVSDQIEKGKNIHEIKQDLIDMGHPEDKIEKAIKCHKKSEGLQSLLFIVEFFHREKIWFKTWLKISLYIFVVIALIISSIIILSPFEKVEEDLTFLERQRMCDQVNEEIFKKLCNSLLSLEKNTCLEIENIEKQQDCKDLFSLYSFYIKKAAYPCSDIRNPGLKEFCFQLSRKECNNFFGYGAECNSIIRNDINYCSNYQKKSFSIEISCNDNYFFYNALNLDYNFCNRINNPNLKQLCKAIA